MSLEQHVDSQLPYEPPTIEDVPLHPDEQVVAGCKVGDFPSPSGGGNPCSQCFTANTS